jgi:hypothetical protein
MSFNWKQLWKEINVYFYFLSTFLIAFVITYLVLINFFYDYFTFQTSNVEYFYNEQSICTGMIVSEKFVFDKCIFTIPLTVYYFNNHYSLEKEDYDNYVKKTSTFLQLILYIYSIFICSFALVIFSKSFLFFCRTRHENQRRDIFHSARVFPENNLEGMSVILTTPPEHLSNENCPICLENLKNGDMIVCHKTCRVIYHMNCVNNYFQVSNVNFKCPTCRDDFF